MKIIITTILTAIVPWSTLRAATNFTTDVAPILAEHCVRCHSDGNPKGEVSLSTCAGVRHGAVPLAAPEQKKERADALKPLTKRKTELTKNIADVHARILKCARSKLADYEATWTRDPVDRTGTEDRFEPVMTKLVRFVCEAQDTNPNSSTGFGIDEFEVWSAGAADQSKNVALAANGGRATGKARSIEDFPGALSERLKKEVGDDPELQIARAYQLCYSRQPTDDEVEACRALMDKHGLTALSRVVLNTSEMIYVR